MSILQPVPNQEAINTALRTFLLSILPSGTEVIAGQSNRASEPSAKNFVVMTPIRRTRLATNGDETQDTVFTAATAGATMTVSAIADGDIRVGAFVSGSGVASGTKVTALGSGTGGTGTYTISPSQTLTSRQMAAGYTAIVQETQVTMQLDVHGPDQQAADNAQVISTLFRDQFAVTAFAAIDPSVAPLYADDPRQAPFINAEQQYEWRWVIEAQLQANQAVGVPQDFAAVSVGLIDVEVAYPAT